MRRLGNRGLRQKQINGISIPGPLHEGPAGDASRLPSAPLPMRTGTHTLDNKWLRLAGLPLIAVLGNFIFYEPDNTRHHVSRGLGLLLSLVETGVHWEISRQGILLARKWCPCSGKLRPAFCTRWPGS